MRSAKQLLILLLGGRIQPAAMLAFQRQPDAVVCIHSVDEPQTARELQRLLRRRFPQVLIADALGVSATVPGQTRTAIETVVARFPGYEVALSLTGAPMPMVVGAYTLAARLGWPAYYLSTADGQILDLASDEMAETLPATFTLRLNVADYLAIYGQQWVNQVEAEGRAGEKTSYSQAMKLLLADLATSTTLLDWLVEGRAWEAPQRRLWQLGVEHWQLFEQLQALGLCQNLAMLPTAKSTYVRFQVHHASHRQFLSGGWLEVAVAQAAQQATRFDDWAYGLVMRSGDAQREVDFLGVRRGQGLIVSCKAGWRFWNKAYLDELGAAAKMLGDNYCTKLFVTHRLRPALGTPGAVALPPFLQHAANQRIVVVTGEDLAKLASILQQESAKPTYARR